MRWLAVIAVLAAICAPSLRAMPDAAATVVDRTVVCAVAREAGQFQFHVGGSPTSREVTPPFNDPLLRSAWPDVLGAGVRSGEGLAGALVGVVGDRGVFLNRQRCRPSTLRVPLSRRGLPGPAVKAVTDVTCVTRAPILVRIRALVGGNGRAASGPYVARGRIVAAQLAVRRARTRKPVAFVSLAAAGRNFRFYSAAACGTTQG